MPQRVMPCILLVFDRDQDRHLISSSLRRRFPSSIVVDAVDHTGIRQALGTLGELDLAVVHRAMDLEGPTVIQEIKTHRPRTRILYVSSDPRKEAAGRQVGADAFLDRARWLMAGKAAGELLVAETN